MKDLVVSRSYHTTPHVCRPFVGEWYARKGHREVCAGVPRLRSTIPPCTRSECVPPFCEYAEIHALWLQDLNRATFATPPPARCARSLRKAAPPLSLRDLQHLVWLVPR